jgi:hypothetical protein
MIKIIFSTIAGLFITTSGFYISYLYLRSLEETTSPLLLILSLPLIAFGIFLLIIAGKSNASIAMAPDKDAENLPIPEGDSLKQVLEQNNAMVDDWANTVSKRDKLKLLEISAAAEKGNT